jgi:hypothetical protein
LTLRLFWSIFVAWGVFLYRDRSGQFEEDEMTELSLQELAAQASLIFRGTVARLNAATMDAVPVTDSIAIVRVDEVLEAPASLANLSGNEITIQFSASPPEPTPAPMIFFTRPWLYGDSIAVVEIGRREVGEGEAADRTAREIVDVTGRRPDQALQDRLNQADAVVAGSVINNRPPSGILQRVTEHDPGLQIAVIAVESVELGELPQPTVDVLYASSRDVMWFQSPKLDVGREGIWLLHRGETRGAVAMPAAAWSCLDPLDELPRDQMDRVRGVIQEIRRQP